MRSMSKRVCTPTTPQSHSCVCEPDQINALALITQPMHRERSVTSYAYEKYTRKPYSDSQMCQVGELADSLDTARDLVVIQVPECAFCATWANVCAYKQHPSRIPVFAIRTK